MGNLTEFYLFGLKEKNDGLKNLKYENKILRYKTRIDIEGLQTFREIVLVL